MSGIKDVARRANVSISTVSRVLNDSCPVNEEKRRRVEEAVRELNYVPNPAARSLLLRRTGTLGVVIPFASGEFFSEFLSGVDQTAADRDHFLLISISHRSESDLAEAIRNLDKRVDGLVVWAPEMKAAHVRTLVDETTPLLILNTSEPDSISDFIDFDNYGGMSQIVTYLVDIGHREFAFVGGPSSASDAQQRLQAYRDTLSARGLVPTPEREFEGKFRFEDGYQAARQVLAMSPRPTALIASNDQTAFGVLTALR
ncbi:MAG: LacI family DNA-binding transcriptional regulator, partial [Rhodothermales bacterium]|nr:LacI family DNA-binding transcriptional regulator [Rhodothermales bacterium]